jgi:PGF-pre-PGF domain-containing protein
MSKNKKFFVNIRNLKKLFNLLIVFFIIYSTLIILDNNILILNVSGQPGEPTSFTASAVGTDQIDLSWSVGANCDKTYIEWKTTSGWNIGEGTELYNDTGTSTSHPGLNAHTTYYYQAWGWNETEGYSSSYASASDITWNTPPSYGTPSPVNESIGIDLSLTWSIYISDGDGDYFDWSIECSNGQSNSATGASSGSKSLSISGLDYSTLYTVWVNATDGYDSVEDWFVFTTGENNPPVFGSPSPANGSTDNPVSLSWSISISDLDGDAFDWSIECSNGQLTNENGESNGTKSLSLSGLEYLTVYVVWVNATDSGGSGLYTRGWYQFTTKSNNPPVFGSPSPANGSTENPLSFTWSIFISDVEGDLFSWSIVCSNGQSSSGSGAGNGTKSLVLSGLSYYEVYTVWVNATDTAGSGQYKRGWYTFTTLVGEPPVFGTPSPVNGSINQPLSLSWSIFISDVEGDLFSWSIVCSNGQSSSGSGAGNGTKSLVLSGLSYFKLYTVWVNATDPAGSGLYTRSWYTFTTLAGQSPVFGTPSPVNGSINQPIGLTWSISISDPEGDLFSWTIQCSNNQSNSGNGVGNSTKSLVLTGLSYVTNYTVWVNATDGFYNTRAWYTFYTKSYSGGGGGGGSGGGGGPTPDNPPLISSVTRTPTKVTSENNITISAIVTDDTGIYSVFLNWNDGSQHSKEMSYQSDNKYSTEIGPFSEFLTITYWINATDNALQSTESISYYFTVADISGPTITIIKPLSGAIIYDTTPTIIVTFSDPSIIDKKSVILTIDSTITTPQIILSSSVTYTPSIEMTYASHIVKLNVSDLLGNWQIKEWSFTIKETEFMNEETIGNLTNGEINEVKLESSDETGIDSINFNVTTNLTNVKISIAKLKDKPEVVGDIPANTTIYCYLYIEITTNGTDIEDDSFNLIKIKFKVNNDWLKNQNLIKNNINLIKYQNGGWIVQESSYISEDSEYSYYEASMSSFSNLAIVGSKILLEETTPVQQFNYIFIFIAVILIIILIVSILFKTGILYIEEDNTK